MKRIVLLGTLLTAAAAVASAQEGPPTPKVEVGLNYSLFHTNSAQDTNSITSNGGSGAVVYNVNHVLGLVADLGAYHNGSVNGLFDRDTTFTYLFGPRFNWRKSRVNPYVEFLFGGARLSGTIDNLDGTTMSSVQTGFATAAGGGIDIALTHHIAIKPIQVEYIMTQLPTFGTNANSFQNNLRYSAGVVLRFGEK